MNSPPVAVPHGSLPDGKPALVILSGLPGTGKTTVAREFARQAGGVHLRIDSIEHVLRCAGWTVAGEGYRVAHAVADDNLRLGQVVIADCVNPWPVTRAEWRAVAAGAGAAALDVEVVCSDPHEHRRRIELRRSDIAGHRLPSWAEVLARDYRAWRTDRLIVDSAHTPAEECARRIVSALQRLLRSEP